MTPRGAEAEEAGGEQGEVEVGETGDAEERKEQEREGCNFVMHVEAEAVAEREVDTKSGQWNWSRGSAHNTRNKSMCSSHNSHKHTLSSRNRHAHNSTCQSRQKRTDTSNTKERRTATREKRNS